MGIRIDDLPSWVPQGVAAGRVTALIRPLRPRPTGDVALFQVVSRSAGVWRPLTSTDTGPNLMHPFGAPRLVLSLTEEWAEVYDPQVPGNRSFRYRVDDPGADLSWMHASDMPRTAVRARCCVVETFIHRLTHLGTSVIEASGIDTVETVAGRMYASPGVRPEPSARRALTQRLEQDGFKLNWGADPWFAGCVFRRV